MDPDSAHHRRVHSRNKSGPQSESLLAARLWACQVRSACEDLYGNPFDQESRAQLVRLLTETASEADRHLRQALSEISSQRHTPKNLGASYPTVVNG